MTLITLYWGLVLLNIVAFLTGKHFKLLSAITSVFLILFVMGKRPEGRVNIGADYQYYQIAYENNDFFSVDYGYILVNKIGRFFSLPFESFYMILVAAIILLLIFSVIRLKGNLHLFLASYLIYFDILTIDLLRNQCAIAILVMAVFVPLYKYKRYWPGLLLSSSFHISFLSYFIPFYLCGKNSRSSTNNDCNRTPEVTRKTNKRLENARKWMITMLIIFVFFFVTGSINIIKPVLSFLFSFLGSAQDRYADYLSSNARMSMLIPLFVYIALIFGINYWRRHCIKISDSDEHKFYADYVYRFALYCSIFLVLTFLSIQCYRFIRDLTLIGIIFMGINTSKGASNFISRLYILLSMLVITFGWFYFDVIMKDYFVDYVATFYINEILTF